MNNSLPPESGIFFYLPELYQKKPPLTRKRLQAYTISGGDTMPCLELRGKVELVYKNHPTQLFIIRQNGTLNEEQTIEAITPFVHRLPLHPCLFIDWHTTKPGCEEDVALALLEMRFGPCFLAHRTGPARHYEVLLSRAGDLPQVGSLVELPHMAQRLHVA